MIHATAALGDNHPVDNDIATGSAPWEAGTTFFDTRLPFETILAPEVSLIGEDFIDMEPHPSASVDFSASLITNDNDGFYTLMARNFFGETANFFLKGQDYTELKSGKIVENKVTFKSGSIYGCRLRLKRSIGNFGERPTLTASIAGEAGLTSNEGKVRRYYNFDRDAWGSTYPNSAYSALGGRYFDTAKNVFVSGTTYELPQDPINPYYAAKITGSISWSYSGSRQMLPEKRLLCTVALPHLGRQYLVEF